MITMTICLFVINIQHTPIVTCEEYIPDYLFIYSPYCAYCQNMMVQVAQYPEFEWISVIEPENKQIVLSYSLEAILAFVICGEIYVGQQNISEIIKVC